MPFDIKALLHNKPALIGIGVAGAAGLYVLARRKQTTGSTASQPTGTGAAGATVGTGFPDTTGTDIASWLGNYSGNLQNQLDQFGKTLTDSLGGVAKIPTEAVTLNEGTPVQAFLKQYNVTLDQLLSLNPGLNLQIKDANASGYISATNKGPVTQQVFNTGTSEPVLVPIPASS